MKIHIFIDAENIPANNALETYDVLSESGSCQCDVVGKKDTLPQSYLKRQGKAFRIHNCDYGKNSADMYLTVCIAKAIYEEDDTDIYAIISNDRDFAPIIQLAVEKKKQVLLLGLEAQSKGLAHSLEQMNVDMEFLTLGTIDSEPPSELIKVEDLPSGLFEYYKKNYKGSTIFVKRGEQLIELPFIEGMHANQFIDLMRRFGIWTKSQKIEDEIGALFMKIVNNRVRFLESAEMMQPPPSATHPKIKRMPDDLKKFYVERFTGDTIFVKRENVIVELPFVNGMHLGRFIQLMRYFKIWSKNQKMEVTRARLDELGLQLKNDYVFFAD